jgi:hypothetical protein
MASMSEAAFTRIESERLWIRRFKDSDLAPFMAYRNDPEADGFSFEFWRVALCGLPSLALCPPIRVKRTLLGEETTELSGLVPSG